MIKFLAVLAAQAVRNSPPEQAAAFRVWPEYAAVDAVCAFFVWGAA